MAALTYWRIYPDAAEKVTDTAECESFLQGIAREALNYAYAAAPDRSGEYKASLFATGREGEDKEPTGRLQSSSWHWHFVEYGTINSQPYRVLTESVSKVVQLYVPSGKPG